MDANSLWSGQTSSARPTYPTPRFVKAQGIEPAAAPRPAATDDEGLQWYREFVARAPTEAVRPAEKAVVDEEEDDEVLWVPQDEGSDSEIEFVEAIPAPPRAAAPPPSPPAQALAPPLPVPNPRPQPSLLPLPASVALPAAPLGTNHFLPFSPPPDDGRAAPKGSRLVDLLVLPSANDSQPAFHPPAYFALGSDNKGHQMLRKAGWDGRALGRASADGSGSSTPHDIDDSDTPLAGPPTSRIAPIAPIATSLLPPQRGLSSALLNQKRVTHTHAQIEASRQQARTDAQRSTLNAKERARRDKEDREHRKGLAAALNAS